MRELDDEGVREKLANSKGSLEVIFHPAAGEESALEEPLAEVGRQLELASGATADDAWRQLVERQPDLAPRRRSLTAAVNRSYVSFDEPLSAGDELVFIPPVSGG